jgi:hypothetical protein
MYIPDLQIQPLFCAQVFMPSATGSEEPVSAATILRSEARRALARNLMNGTEFVHQVCQSGATGLEEEGSAATIPAIERSNKLSGFVHLRAVSCVSVLYFYLMEFFFLNDQYIFFISEYGGWTNHKTELRIKRTPLSTKQLTIPRRLTWHDMVKKGVVLCR